jgi:hypothetical protein
MYAGELVEVLEPLLRDAASPYSITVQAAIPGAARIGAFSPLRKVRALRTKA